MYRLVLVFVLLGFSSFGYNVAKANEIGTVFEYVEQNDLNDEYHMSSLLQRCSGLIGAYAKYLPSSMQSEREQLANLSIEVLTMAGVILAEKNMTNAEATIRQLQTAYLFYVDQYYAQIEKSQLVTGSIFSGSVKDEFDFCLNTIKG
jgi:hypothetical protein